MRHVLRWIGGGLAWLFLGVWAAAVVGLIVRWAIDVEIWRPLAIICVVGLLLGAFYLAVGGGADEYRAPFEDADGS